MPTVKSLQAFLSEPSQAKVVRVKVVSRPDLPGNNRKNGQLQLPRPKPPSRLLGAATPGP